MLVQLCKHSWNTTAKQLLPRIVGMFSKEGGKGQGGKKEQTKAAQPAVIEEPSNNQLLNKWINYTHQSLSPTELQLFSNGFEDLSSSDKQILNDFAEKILQSQTAIFYDSILKKGSLGTSELLFTSVNELSEAQLEQRVLSLRKQL